MPNIPHLGHHGSTVHGELFLLAIEYAIILPLSWIWLFRPRPDGSIWLGDLRPVTHWAALSAFLLVTIPLSALWHRGVLWGDESAYIFQAKAYAAGRLTALSPHPTSDNLTLSANELRFTWCIVRDGQWFGKYPPLWPLVLAVGRRLGAPWLVNPLLGLAAAWVLGRIAQRELALRAPRLAVVTLLTSPYFFLMAASAMSHVLALLLTAIATSAALRFARARQLASVGVAALALVACAFVRPFTAACVALPLSAYVLPHAVANRRLRLGSLGIGLLALACAIIGMAIHNRIYTGEYTTSPYALYRGTTHAHAPLEITLSLDSMWETALTHGRWGLQETMLSSFPFVYLLAGYAVVTDRHRRRENALLASLTVVLFLGHLLNPQGSSPRFGERYIFEGFFGVTLLAARGFSLLSTRHRLDQTRVRQVGRLLFAVNAVLALLMTSSVLYAVTPYAAVRDCIAAAKPDQNTTVFLDTQSRRFLARQFNLNEADWTRGPLYLVDPGPTRRREVSLLQGRQKWIVVGYDDATESPKVIESVATSPHGTTTVSPD